MVYNSMRVYRCIQPCDLHHSLDGEYPLYSRSLELSVTSLFPPLIWFLSLHVFIGSHINWVSQYVFLYGFSREHSAFWDLFTLLHVSVVSPCVDIIPCECIHQFVDFLIVSSFCLLLETFVNSSLCEHICFSWINTNMWDFWVIY